MYVKVYPVGTSKGVIILINTYNLYNLNIENNKKIK
jgi:hypothetical protein